MIPLGHNRTNGAVYSKINFKVEICKLEENISVNYIFYVKSRKKTTNKTCLNNTLIDYIMFL